MSYAGVPSSQLRIASGLVVLVLRLSLIGCDSGDSTGEVTPPDTTTFLSLGLEDMKIFALHMADPYLYATTERDGLWRTNVREGVPTDERVWEFVGTPAADDTAIRRILIDVVVNPADPNQIMVTATFDGVFFRSVDGGQTWMPRPDVLSSFKGEFLEYSDRILLGARYETRDFGETWTLLDTARAIHNGFNTFARPPVESNLIWAGGSSAVETPLLGYSKDGGRTWTMLDIQELAHAYPVSSIGFDPDDVQAAYIATRGTIYLTRDLGSTWTSLPVSEGQNAFLVMVSTPELPEYLLAGGSTLVNLVETRDDGATWQVVHSPLLDRKAISDMIWDGQSKAAYLGTFGGVVRYKPRLDSQ